jgi:hypothetical protein
MGADTSQKHQKEPSAVVMRGPDGALYLIRDDVLDLCRMTKEDAVSAEKILQSHKAGKPVPQASKKGHFSLETASFEPLGRVKGTFTPMAVKLTAESTIMCCWSSLCFRD